MIYLERRDGRKELGVGFVGRGGGGGGDMMDDTELEEGEAYDFHHHHDNHNDNIDPDVDLAYLDDKVQYLLGHLQKDFEGGVSAENLGSKFGGYGSFLPTYQRSPSVLTHPKTPQKVQSFGTPKSPRSFPSEGACQNSAVLPSVTPSVKVGPASTSAAPASVSRAPFVENSSRRDRNPLLINSTGEFTSKREPVNKAFNCSDPKSLKVRIKVGSDNISNKTAEIFSGLGLDSSPFSSPEDSPVESGGLSPKSQVSPDKSPTSILEIMTSFPVAEGVLSSPLLDSLLHLTEKKPPLRDSRSSLVCNSSMLVEESPSGVGEGRVFGEKKMKSMENRGRSVEVKNRAVKDGNDISVFLKKEVDIETAEGRELASNSLKLPLLYDLNSTLGDSARDMGKTLGACTEVRRSRANDTSFLSDYVKEEDSMIGAKRAEKLKTKSSSGDKSWEDGNEISHKDIKYSPRKDGKSKRNKNYDPIKSDFDGSKGRRDLNNGTIDPPKDKGNLKATPDEQEGAKASYGSEQALSGGKKQSRGSKSNGNLNTELPKERVKFVSSSTSRDKKKSSSDSSSKNKLDDNKLFRESGKERESHRDFLGDVKMEQAESSLEFPPKDRPKNHKLEATEKQNYQFADKSKDRPTSKKNDNQLTSAAYPKGVSTIAPPAGNGSVSDAPTTAPVLIEENWVGCDRCQKWRLLPYGRNPEHLPKKWLCSMLDWLPLPGMNRCSVSEEETTKALHALYVNVPDAQSTQHTQPIASGGILPEVQHIDVTHQDPNLQDIASGGKKKHGVKETPHTYLASKHLPNSTKKNQQSSMKSRSLNDVNQSPLHSNLANKAGVQHLSKSNDSGVEKHGHKRKEEHKLAADGGNANHPKMKFKRDADQDGYRSSKKIRKEGLSYADAEWNSDTDGIMGKTAMNGMSATTVGKGVPYVEYSSSKDQNCDAERNLLVSAKKTKDVSKVPLDERAMDIAKADTKDIATKKRKVKEWQESQIYPPDTLVDTARLEGNQMSFREGTSESEHKKEKKARVSKSEGKDKSKGSDTTDKSDRATRILISSSKGLVADGMENGRGYIEKEQRPENNRTGNLVSQQMLDSVESLKRDLGYGQPSLGATSSSSKVSGSRKSKGNFQETIGSPVESVSSSPFRIANPDKSTSPRLKLTGKDDAANVAFSVMGSPRRCSDGEGDGGSDRSGTKRKAKASSVLNRGSLESSVFDYSDRDATHTSGGKAGHNEPSRYQFESPHMVNGGVDALDHYNEYGKLGSKRHGLDGERVDKNRNGSNGSLSGRSGKGHSSRSKDKKRSFTSDIDKGELKVSDSLNDQDDFFITKSSKNEMDIESQNLIHSHKEQRDDKRNFQETSGVKSGKEDRNYLGKKDSSGNWSSEGRKENRSKYGNHTGSDAKLVSTSSKDGKSNQQKSLLQDRVSERFSHRSLSDRTDELETASRRGKSKLLLHSGDKQETQARYPPPMPIAQRGSGSDVLGVDSSNDGGSDALKGMKLPRKPDSKAGTHHNSLRHSTSNGLSGDLDGPSSVRKDSSSQTAANALKEAKDLKHTADRLKNSGSDLDSTGLYFQAALKFLLGASLLEPSNIENSKHGETQSSNVYSSTAGLCGFVAHEYERRKEMAAAALAYKCMEVAYLRVIYFKHTSANKDRLELQGTLQMVPPGESPSSSASDVDNLNNQGALEKAALSKGVSSPHVGNLVIAARHRPSFERLLNFTQEVHFAMDASKKSVNAFQAAGNLEKSQYDCVSRAIHCSFYDVQAVLHLVRLAIEAISR